MPANDLRRARRARARLSAAGWMVVAAGLLIAATAAIAAPFLFPFGLATGALSALAGRQLVRLRGAAGALLGAGASVLVGGAAAVSGAGGSEARWLTLGLAAALAVLGAGVLAIVYLDAAYLPDAPEPESD